ncbi:GFA family protein [Novosphingobium lentum]|uniref:GFA family protein n=1 Tax=Novosphingobium lentum TaxID=145287 RepID=UPI0008302055|nr:GFA family protein [Novosphingobium lentum]
MAGTIVRVATCRCGQLQATCTGEPVRVSVCHCLDCQKRSGSAFAVQARWPHADVTLAGEFTEWSHTADSGSRATFRFCPRCGATVTFAIAALPGLTGVPVGAFADPQFPPPAFSVYEARMHSWVAIVGADVERWD